jgi:hypothetical protein
MAMPSIDAGASTIETEVLEYFEGLQDRRSGSSLVSERVA